MRKIFPVWVFQTLLICLDFPTKLVWKEGNSNSGFFCWPFLLLDVLAWLLIVVRLILEQTGALNISVTLYKAMEALQWNSLSLQGLRSQQDTRQRPLCFLRVNVQHVLYSLDLHSCISQLSCLKTSVISLFLVVLSLMSFVIHRFIPFAAHLASLFSLQRDLSGTSEREEIIRGEESGTKGRAETTRAENLKVG